VIQLLIFDLDGTLIDSKLDLAQSVNASRAHMGMGPLDLAVISTYVGRGAPVLIRKALGPEATDIQVAQALEFFLEHYREHALDTTRLYPGVKASLDRFHAAGKSLAILTNKPVAVSRTIIEGLSLSRLFFQIYGGNSFAAKKPDPIGIKKLMEEAGVCPDRTIMVGDTTVDVETARNAGVRACGVTYGFTPESLRQTPPDLLIDRMEDLADWVLRNDSVGLPPARLFNSGE
jgi:phosphoglycolate phosphatase